MDAATQEFVTESLEAQGFPASMGTDLAVAFTRLRSGQMAAAAARLRAQDRVAVVYRREL